MQILDTPPVHCVADGKAQVVTQIYPPDLVMYLVAIKTFARFVPIKSVVVVGDRLMPTDKRVIAEHVRPVEIIDIEDVDTDGMPRGGCWERLITIIRLTANGYTIQLDSDTITQSPPAEVLDCIAGNRSFTLGTAMGKSVTDAEEASAAVSHLASSAAHVQVLAEIALKNISPQPVRYVRGNAAFAGFAHRAYTVDALRDFSAQMMHLLGGAKWKEWGSEQVASNYMIANSPSPYVLPFDRYRYFQPGAPINECPLIHFMGTYRFARGVYRHLARHCVRSLLNATLAD